MLCNAVYFGILTQELPWIDSVLESKSNEPQLCCFLWHFDIRHLNETLAVQLSDCAFNIDAPVPPQAFLCWVALLSVSMSDPLKSLV